MRKMNLQFFAKKEAYTGVKKPTGKPLSAKKVWYFIQSVTAPIGSPALLPAFQTEGSVTYGGENIDEQTKMGRIIQKSTDEHSVDLTQYFVLGDESINVVKDAKKNGRSVKVWRVVVDSSVAEPVSGQKYKLYPAEFGYGMPDEVEVSDGDELVEASYTLNIIGALQSGKFPLTDEDVRAIEALYEYQNPGETTGDFDHIQTIQPPVISKVTPNATGAKIEVVTSGSETFKIYKGIEKATEGASPLTITGIGSSTDVTEGTYQIVRVEEGKESERVNIPAFRTN